jgi:hypothetical protein
MPARERRFVIGFRRRAQSGRLTKVGAASFSVDLAKPYGYRFARQHVPVTRKIHS